VSTSSPMVVPDSPKSTISRRLCGRSPWSDEEATDVAAQRPEDGAEPSGAVSQPEWLSIMASLGARSAILCEPDHSLVNFCNG